MSSTPRPGLERTSLLFLRNWRSLARALPTRKAVSAILGGCKVDLRGAAIKSDRAVLELFTVWGGIEVLIPSAWAVQLEGFPILGGFDDKTHPNPQGETKRLIIRGTAIMGGIEVKN